MKKIFLIIGRTASGKSSIAREVCNRMGLTQVISYTTRPMRKGERQNSDHIFISPEDVNFFRDDIAAYTEINGYEYFTTMDILDKSDVYVIDPNGVKDLRERVGNLYEFVEIYIRIPKTVAEDRARARGDKLKDFRTRWDSESDQFFEYEKSYTFDYNLINNRPFEESVEKVCGWISRRMGD